MTGIRPLARIRRRATVRRVIAFAITALVTTSMLAGCAAAVTPGRLGEYEARAEQLTTELVAAIPDALQADETSQQSQAFFGEPLGFDPSRELAWWEVATRLEFPDSAAVDDATDAIGAYFDASEDGWARETAEDAGDGMTGVVYRLGDAEAVTDDDAEWLVEVQHGATRIDIRVQSPLTVRGDETG